ncbi:MAG: methionyl-tRNA formyltransferase [Treponema sp.]
MMEKLSICLLASGNLGLTLLNHIALKSNCAMHSVFTDKKSDGIISFCKENNIACFSGNPRGGVTANFRASLITRPDIILSVNYLFLIEKDLISYPIQYAVNVHGSLLPKYRGRTPHVWAIINGEKKTGITAHLITSECDKGAIIAQKEIPVSDSDTGGTILAKYKEFYPLLIDEVIKKILFGNLADSITEQDETMATYYPKRTPDDGKIDWNWQKERIYNWVRAMAPPEYPGAFFFDDGKKIIVQKIEFLQTGFPQGAENGKVIAQDKNSYIIKVPNGCVKAVVYSSEIRGGGYNYKRYFCSIVHTYHFSNQKAGLLCV